MFIKSLGLSLPWSLILESSPFGNSCMVMIVLLLLKLVKLENFICLTKRMV